MNSTFSKRRVLWIMIGVFLAGMFQVQAAQKKYDSRSSIGTISLEAGLNFTLFNHELIPILGIRWNFYKK